MAPTTHRSFWQGMMHMTSYRYLLLKQRWNGESEIWSDGVAAASNDEMSIEHGSRPTENCGTYEKDEIMIYFKSSVKDMVANNSSSMV